MTFPFRAGHAHHKEFSSFLFFKIRSISGLALDALHLLFISLASCRGQSQTQFCILMWRTQLLLKTSYGFGKNIKTH